MEEIFMDNMFPIFLNWAVMYLEEREIKKKKKKENLWGLQQTFPRFSEFSAIQVNFSLFEKCFELKRGKVNVLIP